MACNKYSLVQYKCCRPASDVCQFRARLGKPTIAMSDAAPNSQFCANRVAPRRLSRRVVYRAATIFAATNCTECVDPASAPRAEKTSSRLTDKVVECHAHRLHNLALCLAIFLIVSYLCLLPHRDLRLLAEHPGPRLLASPALGPRPGLLLTTSSPGLFGAPSATAAALAPWSPFAFAYLLSSDVL